jgi:hypothetical protein
MSEATLASLGMRVVGRWTTESTHPDLPGTVINGTADIEWLEGERFLILRSRNDHPDFPDAISIVGDTRAVTAEDVAADRSEELHLHYFDSRGVYRVYDVSIKPDGWEWALKEPGWAQRLPLSFADGDRTMSGTSRLSVDNGPWNDDLEVTYRRR